MQLRAVEARAHEERQQAEAGLGAAAAEAASAMARVVELELQAELAQKAQEEHVEELLKGREMIRAAGRQLGLVIRPMQR